MNIKKNLLKEELFALEKDRSNLYRKIRSLMKKLQDTPESEVGKEIMDLRQWILISISTFI